MLNEISFFSFNNVPNQYAWVKNFENNVIQGIIRGSSNEKWVEWKGIHITLPEDLGIPEGSLIQIRISSTSQGYTMSIESIKEPTKENPNTQSIAPSLQSDTSPGSRTININELVQKIVELNPVLKNKVDLIIRLFSGWFDESNTTNFALLRISQIISEAVEKGIIESAWLKIIPDVISFSADGKMDLQGLSKILQQQIQSLNLEKQLFHSDNKGINIKEVITNNKDYRALQLLIKNESFVSFLKNSGDYQKFQKALDTLFSKSTANQVLSLSATNFTYLVFELPVSLDNGFFWARIHTYYPRKEDKNKDSKPQYAVIAFDIHLVNAGKMWIELRCLDQTLECVMKIAEEKTRKMCSQFTNELENNLESLGFKNISVFVQDWDGDRVKTTYHLFDSMQKKGWAV